MSRPIALGPSTPPSSPPSMKRMDWGDSALTAPTTPGRRVAVVDRSKANPQIVAAAEGMEAMFLDYMMKVMRQSVPKNELDLDSPATQVYTSMMDTETAQRAAHAGGVGLADQIIAYLEPPRYNLPREQDAPRVQGGTHAGESERK